MFKNEILESSKKQDLNFLQAGTIYKVFINNYFHNLEKEMTDPVLLLVNSMDERSHRLQSAEVGKSLACFETNTFTFKHFIAFRSYWVP